MDRQIFKVRIVESKLGHPIKICSCLHIMFRMHFLMLDEQYLLVQLRSQGTMKITSLFILKDCLKYTDDMKSEKFLARREGLGW